VTGSLTLPLDVRRIMKMIPHRFPMLLVDKVIAFEPNVSATGIKAVTINEPFFAGHFPDRPIMPGVLIIEALAQTAGIHAVGSMGLEAEGKLVYFMAIENAKFRKPVEPGVLLELVVTVEKIRGPVWRYAGKALIDGAVAAEAQFTAMIADPPAA
jgi:3-hydroxyacyl-[acyl-carrier-protein] dehydratase